jgi:ATP phosphoribosyltransferase
MESGLHIDNGDIPRLQIRVKNFPVKLLYLRDDDIPGCVKDGVADAGIVGENVVAEKGFPVKLVEKLGFARCQLSIGVPRDMSYEKVSDLNELNIATTYPNILKKYLSANNVKARIHEISGSVEIAPGIGLSDAIFDIVSSGSTLMNNGLKEVEMVMSSQAVLISQKTLPKGKHQLLDKLIFRFKAAIKARAYRYILLNAPNESIEYICNILPGMKSPTIMPLVTEGWSSLHSVIAEDEFWEVIEKLKTAGAQGILVMPIEKMIT